jgi:hypothetical protein
MKKLLLFSLFIVVFQFAAVSAEPDPLACDWIQNVPAVVYVGDYSLPGGKAVLVVDAGHIFWFPLNTTQGKMMLTLAISCQLAYRPMSIYYNKTTFEIYRISFC